MKDYFAIGWDAFVSGTSLDENPFTGWSGREWVDGWNACAFERCTEA